MIRKRIEAELDPWITEARASLIASFATGIGNDKAAVCAAITEPWLNGQTEGQITKLKLVKRQMAVALQEGDIEVGASGTSIALVRAPGWDFAPHTFSHAFPN
jgi:hypothetical protein